MTIKISCQCGKRLAVQSRLAGKRIRCPSCSEPISVPMQQSSSTSDRTDTASITNRQGATNPAKLISVQCNCGARLRIKNGLVGQSLKCPKCGSPIATVANKQEGGEDQGIANWFGEQLPSVSALTSPVANTHILTQPPEDGQHGPRCSQCEGALFPLGLFGGIRTCGRCEIDVYLVNSQNCISSGWILRAGRNEPGHDRERIKDFRMLIRDAADAVRENSHQSSRRFGAETFIELIFWNVLSTNVYRRELRHMKILLSLIHKQTGYEFATWAENPSRWFSFLPTFQRRT